MLYSSWPSTGGKLWTNNDYVVTMAMDLSKVFVSMPHGLLIAKLRAYGLSENACNMIVSYLSYRRQRVKISGEVSNWCTINRGVPQGSVLGPLLFNIFLNDLFLVQISGNIANYADHNHLYNKNVCVENLRDDLVNDNSCITDAKLWWNNMFKPTSLPINFRITSQPSGLSHEIIQIQLI